MSTHQQGLTTATESRALELLGAGLEPEVVANALGVSASRISQLLSDEQFAIRVAEIRFKNLQKHNKRDTNYDELEDLLIERLHDILPFMNKPQEVLRAIHVVNGAKRRGSSAPESIVNKQNIVNIVMPTIVVQKFTTNAVNQVVQTGEQELVTMQAGRLLENVGDAASGKSLQQDTGNEHATAAKINLSAKIAELKERHGLATG